MAQPSLFKSNIFPILLVNFIGILGYSVVTPILIFIVIDFGGNGFIYGLIGATYPFFQFLGAPMLGRLSDRIGRKKVLILSQAGTFLSWVLFLLAFILPQTEIWSQDSKFTGSYLMTLPLLVIFVARMFDGFTGGNISVANAYLSDISTDEDRSENFGKMGSASSLGFVVGPAFSGLLAATILGEVVPLIIAALISLVAIFVILFRLKESDPCVVDTKGVSMKNIRRFFHVEHRDCYTEGAIEYGQGANSSSWRSILAIKGIPLLFTVYFLSFLGFSLFYASMPLYVSKVLHWSAIELGIFLAYFSLVMVFVQGPVLSRLSKRTSSLNLVLFGSLLLGASFLMLDTENLVLLYAAATIMAFGNGIMWASFLTILSGTGDPKKQGAIQGYGTSMGSIASMLGLVIGGLLFENLSTTVFFIAAAVFFLIALMLQISSASLNVKPEPVTQEV